jgi:simple sugar transport system substrate-binding protein
LKFDGKFIKAAVASAFVAAAPVMSAADTPAEKPVKITLIVHSCLGNSFWEPLLKGARDAAEMLHADVDFQNAEFDPAKQVNYIEQAIASKQDAILPMIAMPEAMTEPLKKAMAAGIKVIAINTDDPAGDAAGNREAYIGQNFVEAGELIGNRIVKDGNIGKGDKCLLPAESPEQHHQASRAEGVQNALHAVGAEGEILRTGDKPEDALNLISQYLLANPDTKCIIGLGNTPTSVIPQAVEEAGMAALPNGGFDTSPQIMKNIVEGKTIATVDQQPYWQGFMGVVMATYEVRYGLAPANWNSSNGLIDKDNADIVAQYSGTYR